MELKPLTDQELQLQFMADETSAIFTGLAQLLKNIDFMDDAQRHVAKGAISVIERLKPSVQNDQRTTINDQR
jgi:hypothetical protein